MTDLDVAQHALRKATVRGLIDMAFVRKLRRCGIRADSQGAAQRLAMLAGLVHDTLNAWRGSNGLTPL